MDDNLLRILTRDICTGDEEKVKAALADWPAFSEALKRKLQEIVDQRENELTL